MILFVLFVVVEVEIEISEKHGHVFLEVVERAAQILKNLEANEIDVNAPQKVVRKPRKKLSELPGQMTFF